MDLNNIKKIHFIGIGGVAMSAVAAICKQLDYIISGSDNSDIYPPSSTVLEKNNIEAYSGYKIENLDNPDLVVIGAGESSETNPEVAEVVSRNIPYVSFPELLYELFRDYTRIVISGTHGKTTTSSLLAYVMDLASKPANFMIGGYVRDFDTNFNINNSKNIIIEGDEYFSSFADKKPKFLHYHPDILVITNIDMDHFDYYKNLTDVMDKFNKLIKTVPPNGVIIACHDDKNIKKLLKDVEQKVIWYGLKGKDLEWKADKTIYEDGKLNFKINNVKESKKYEATLSLTGDHNVLNTLAVIAVVNYLGIDINSAIRGLVDFKGPARRFEIKGVARGVTVIDDYAHHPTAVKATLKAAKSRFPDSRILAIFEPHTYSRTQATLSELSTAFDYADKVIIPDIYPAREHHSNFNVTSKKLVDEIGKNHQNATYIPEREGIIEDVINFVEDGDVIVIMAVGNFNQISTEIIDKL